MPLDIRKPSFAAEMKDVSAMKQDIFAEKKKKSKQELGGGEINFLSDLSTCIFSPQYSAYTNTK